MEHGQNGNSNPEFPEDEECLPACLPAAETHSHRQDSDRSGELFSIGTRCWLAHLIPSLVSRIVQRMSRDGENGNPLA